MAHSEPTTTTWLTHSEAADYLRVSRNTLYRWAEAGALKYHEGPGGHRRYRVQDCDDALAAAGAKNE